MRAACPAAAGDRAGVRRGPARGRRPRRRARPARRLAAPPLHRSIRARLALAAVCARGLTLPPRLPAAGLRPRGRRHSPPRDARAARHRYDVSNEFFALFLALADRHEHRACRSIPARREDAGGGPPGEARVRLRQARARARRACASAAAAAAGAASRSTVVPLAALSSSGSLGPSPRRASRSTGRRGRASPTGSRSARWITASSPASASTRSRASAWLSTSVASRSIATRSGSQVCLSLWDGC